MAKTRKNWRHDPTFNKALNLWHVYHDWCDEMDYRKGNFNIPRYRVPLQKWLNQNGWGHIPRGTFYRYARRDKDDKHFWKYPGVRVQVPRRRLYDPFEIAMREQRESYKRPLPEGCRPHKYSFWDKPKPVPREQLKLFSDEFLREEEKLKKECERTEGGYWVMYISPLPVENGTQETLHITSTRRREMRKELAEYYVHQSKLSLLGNRSLTNPFWKTLMLTNFALKNLDYCIERGMGFGYDYSGLRREIDMCMQRLRAHPLYRKMR